MKQAKLYKSNNLEWGFFGTSQRNYDLSESQTEIFFDFAVRELNKLSVSNYLKTTHQTQEKLFPIDYLDSRYGRHLSDSISFHIPQNCTLDQLKIGFKKALKVW
jgi:hypothetical protein